MQLTSFLERFEAFYGDDQDHVEDLEPKVYIDGRELGSNISDDWPVITRYFRRALPEETEWGELFRRYFGIVRGSIDRLDAQGLSGPMSTALVTFPVHLSRNRHDADGSLSRRFWAGQVLSPIYGSVAITRTAE